MSRSVFKKNGKVVPSDEVLDNLAICEVCGNYAKDHNYQFAGDSGHLYCPTDARRLDPSAIELVHERTDKLNALREQIGGDHYKNRAIQPIEYCHKNKLGPCESAVVKYITRWREKGGLQDLEKAKHTIDLLIDLEGLKQNVGADHGQTHPG